MILIATENIRTVDQIRWIVDIVDNICVNIVDVVRYIIPAATTRAQLLSNVAEEIILLVITAAAVVCRRCTRGCVCIEDPIVMREENVVVAVVDVDLCLGQRR